MSGCFFLKHSVHVEMLSTCDAKTLLLPCQNMLPVNDWRDVLRPSSCNAFTVATFSSFLLVSVFSGPTLYVSNISYLKLWYRQYIGHVWCQYGEQEN